MKIRNAAVAGCILLGSGVSTAALHDRGGGLIYDDVLNITWMQDVTANAHPSQFFPEAKAWASDLSFYDSVRQVTWDDWRLPKVNVETGASEMFNLYAVTLGNSGPGAPNVGPFNLGDAPNVIWNIFFIDSQDPGDVIGWRFFFFGAGGQQPELPDGGPSPGYNTWAVRDGDVAAVPEPETFVLMMAGLVVVGSGARLRRKIGDPSLSTRVP